MQIRRDHLWLLMVLVVVALAARQSTPRGQAPGAQGTAAAPPPSSSPREALESPIVVEYSVRQFGGCGRMFTRSEFRLASAEVDSRVWYSKMECYRWGEERTNTGTIPDHEARAFVVALVRLGVKSRPGRPHKLRDPGYTLTLTEGGHVYHLSHATPVLQDTPRAAPPPDQAERVRELVSQTLGRWREAGFLGQDHWTHTPH